MTTSRTPRRLEGYDRFKAFRCQSSGRHEWVKIAPWRLCPRCLAVQSFVTGGRVYFWRGSRSYGWEEVLRTDADWEQAWAAYDEIMTARDEAGLGGVPLKQDLDP